jgi:hypothetical protein
MISNLAEIEAFRTMVNNGGITTSGKEYILTADIDLSGTWTPIGTGANPFRGKFYGNGHTISGLRLEDGQYSGLFGIVSGAEIRDLKVVIDNDAAISASYGGIQYLGGLAGHATNTVFDNVTVDVPPGKVLGMNKTSNHAVYAGGIAGYVSGTTITNSRVQGGSLLVDKTASGAGNAYAGGFAGYMAAGSRIENAAAALHVKAKSVSNIIVCAGGLAGYIENSAIDGASVSGNVEVDQKNLGHIFIGGAVGRGENGGSVSNIGYSGTLTMNKDASNGMNICGGIAGRLAGTSMDSCTYTGNINIPGTYAATYTTEIGGIVGNFVPVTDLSPPVVKNCVSRGDIRFEGSLTEELHLGGVAGYLDGITTGVRLEDCVYDDGNILFAASGAPGSDAYIGGLVGSVLRNSTIVNCRSLAASVSAHYTSSGSEIKIGGFAGTLTQVDIAGCYSTSPVSVPAGHQGSAAIYIGGFAGYLVSKEGIASSMADCYATGPVTSYGGGQQYSGGLVGRVYISSGSLLGNYPANSITRCYAAGAVSAFNRNSTSTANTFSTGGLAGVADGTNISECYATGAVSAQKSSGIAPVNAGGLVGFLGSSGSAAIDAAMKQSSITNCYALGDVFAGNTSATAAVYAGGLVGYTQIASGGDNPAAGTVGYNFAAGSVTAQSAASSAVYAGGVAGYMDSGALSGNAAFGGAVTVKGSGTKMAARVYAYPAGSGGAHNYAVDTMRIESGSYSDLYIVPAYETGSDGTSPQGATANGSTFRNSGFWTSTLDFNTGTWNMSGVVSRGYPALVNVGGQ